MSSGTGTMLMAGDVITTTQTIFVYAETGTTPNCTDENSFVVTINDSPDVDAMADIDECNSYTLPNITGTNLSGNEIYYTASGGNGTSYSAGDVINFADFPSYPVTLFIYDETGTTPNCSDEESFELILQDCNVVEPPSTDIEIPRFFTPNNDGFNDIWSVANVFDIDPNSRVYIFDRYGKLLKQLTTTRPFWDGTFNGNNMPSSDYWYAIEFIQLDDNNNQTTRVLKGHFTLKR
jgi:gliding motility-associated-like protein